MDLYNYLKIDFLEKYLDEHNYEELSNVLIDISKNDKGKYYIWKVRKYYRALPLEFVKGSYLLLSDLSMIYMYAGDVEESKKYYSLIEELQLKMKDNPREYELIQYELNYLGVSLPYMNKDRLYEALEKASMAAKDGYSIHKLSITCNRPSVVSGGRDYTKYREYRSTIMSPLKEIVSRLFGAEASIGMIEVAKAEILYQENNVLQALVQIVSILPKLEAKGDVSILFVVMFLQMSIMTVTGQSSSTRSMMEGILERIKKNEAYYLLPNFKALNAWAAMYDNNYQIVKEWMENDAPNEFDEFFSLDRFQYFVKLRAYLAYGKHIALLSLAERLRPTIIEYGRYMEECELEMILAMSYHDENKKEEAYLHLENALKLAEKYRYDRLICDDGIRMYNLLKEYKEFVPNNEYLNSVEAMAKEVALLYPHHLIVQGDGIENLTKAEKEVLRLMKGAMTNEEIGDFMCISVNTVKFHSKNIYSKLEVKNRSQAVKKALSTRLI